LYGVCLSGARAGDFDAANQAYEQGKFAEAKGAYERVIASGAGNANAFYNLGNAEFRLGEPGRAILDYERALALNPRHPEAQANLKLVRDQNGARLLPLAWYDELAAYFSPKVWILLAAVAGWVVLFSIVLLVTSRRAENAGKWTICLLSAAVGAVAAVALWSVARDQTVAIVTANQTDARLAPAESAGIAAALPAGSQVRVLSERGDWVYCELPASGRGWIPNNQVERVRPAKS
jgi:tetratricopeptide (TPR) repeat protein